MKNSRHTQETIARWWAENPMHVSAKSGNLITGPVRLAFCNVLQRPKAGADGKEKAYGSVLLFPFPVTEEAALKPARDAVLALYKENMPAALTNPAIREKLHKPFKDQGSFTSLESGECYAGFTPGLLAISANSSQSQPAVVDQNGAPITEKTRVYSGCWAIVALRPAWFKVDGNQGPTFYLQSVMVVADDESLGGAGAANPSADFAAVKVDASIAPADLFA
jgi:hypothetical protein